MLGIAQSPLYYKANTGRILSGLVVKYNPSGFTYLTSKAGYSDTGSFVANSNVIGVATLDATNPNTGLGYDDNTDSFLHQNQWFTRDAFYTAAAAAAGTIPTFWQTTSATGSQGIAVDPINDYLWRYQSTTQFTLKNHAGTTIDDINPTPGSSEGSMCFWDPVEEILYITGSTGEIYGLQKVLGTWTVVFNPWYRNNEGGCLDYVFNKFVGNTSPLTMREQDLATGLNIVNHPYPSNAMAAVQEGFIVDIKDGTFWMNSDQEFHGGIVDGNRLWHTDPRGLYLKYYRTPDMDTWTSLWKMNGNVALGRLNGQYIRGNNYSVGPVIDYGAYTGQQTIGNWTFPREGEDAHLQWRGSGTAPTTTPETDVQYHDLVLYDANGTNDGWGSTSPGAWQDTPTTDRYMQVRAKPLPFVATGDTYTPLVLGSTLHYWYSSKRNTGNEYYSINNIWYDSEAIEAWNDVKSREVQFATVAPQRPVYDVANSFIDFNSASGHFLSCQQTSQFLSEVGTDVEINVVMRKPTAANRAIILTATTSTTNNDQILLQHIGSGGTGGPANSLCITYINNSGTVTRHGIVDASSGTFRMITFRFHVDQGGGDFDNEIYIDKVKQTLTNHSGTNDGQSFNLVAGVANTVRLNRIHQNTSSVNGTTDMRDIVVSGHLTTQQRSDLYDYFVAQGQL